MCSTVPAGVLIATASASGIEWLTAKNSHSNGPSRSVCPSATVSEYGSMRRSAQLRLDQGQRELRADQRDVRLVRQQVRHRADVVLVPVGEHDRLDVVQPVQDGREVGQDQVDAGLVDVREQHSTVDDEQLAAVLEDGHVAADRAEPAERGDPQAALGQRRWRGSSSGGVSGIGHGAGSSGRSRPASAQSLRSWATSAVGRVDQRRAHRPGRQAAQRSAPP